MRRLAIFVAALSCCLQPLPRASAQDTPPGCDPAFLINSLADYKSSKDTLEDLQILGRLDDEIQSQMKACMSLVTTPTPAPLPSATPTAAITGPVLPPTSAAPFGSRDNPVPFGVSMVLDGKPNGGLGEITIVVNSVYPEDDEIAKANQFNDLPGRGQEYYAANIIVKATGGTSAADFALSDLDFQPVSDNQILAMPSLVWPSYLTRLNIRLLPDSSAGGFVLGKWFTDDPHPMLVLWRTNTFPGYFFDVKQR